MKGPKTVTLPPKQEECTGTGEPTPSPSNVCCDKIREVAYLKWEAAGCPCGDGVEFWLQAEAELVSKTQPEAKASEA